MQTVAGRVACREHESPTVVQLIEWVYTVPYLIEEGYEVVWMRGRALAVIDTIWVSHMGLVIRRVEVHAIPAAREDRLGPEAIRAGRVCESWCLRLSWAVEIDAKLSCFHVSLDIGIRRRKKLTKAKRWLAMRGCLCSFEQVDPL